MRTLWAFTVLCGCATVDLGESPADVGLCNPSLGMEYFTAEIWPNYLHPADPAKDCAKSGCHATRAPVLDVTEPIDYARNYRVTQGYINCGQPMASRLLTLPLAGIDGHPGGDVFTSTSDPAVETFLGWF